MVAFVPTMKPLDKDKTEKAETKTIPPGIYAGFQTSKNEKAYIFGLNTAPEKLLAFRGLLSVSIVFLSRCKLHKGLKAEFGFL